MLTNVYSFFTAWVMLLLFFYRHTRKYIDVLFLALVSFIIGSYLSFVNPKEYKYIIFDEQYVVRGWTRLFLVEIIHVLMLVFAMHVFKKPTYKSFLLANLILIIYVLLFDVKRVYNVTFVECFWTYLATAILYVNIMFV